VTNISLQSNQQITAFILAAGFGERLRPLTNHIPKPLMPILGKPLLQHLLDKIEGLAPTAVGINLHYKHDVLEEWIRHSSFRDKVALYHEDPILGTGGALKNAVDMLGKNTFLVHNSDIVSDIDLSRLIGFHFSSGNIATLALHDCPAFNNVLVDDDNCYAGIAKNTGHSGKKLHAFTGIAVYEPAFLDFLPEGASHVVDAWTKALSAGHRIGVLDVSGGYWSDIGTPAAYASAIVHELRSDGETIYVHPTAHGCGSAEIDGFVVLEHDCLITGPVSLRNCIALPGAAAGRGVFENCLLGPGFTVNLDEREMHGQTSSEGHIHIGTGGSDRSYYRVQNGKDTTVLMRCSTSDIDFDRHIAYTCFFSRYGLPVPQIISVDHEKKEAVFEDLGNLSFYSLLKCRPDPGRIETLYKKILDMIVKLHTEITDHIVEMPILTERSFDYDHFRWETSYFHNNFVSGIKGAVADDPVALDAEFHRLAVSAGSFPVTIIHRDLQSQNIMVTRGDVPRLIDYQGARLAPPAYDIASFLWDPYYRPPDMLRERLLDYYISGMKKYSAAFDEALFRESLLPCRLQRHMQALGAYGFLAVVKGKRYFLKHIDEGLRLLKEESGLARNEYPELYKLAGKLC